MTDLKVILAQALDGQRETSRAEMAADRHQDRLAKSSKRQHELPTLRAEYGAIYQRLIQALLKMNFVRKQTPDAALEAFCGARMVEWMDGCERLRDKQSGILFPLTNAVTQEVISLVTPGGGGDGQGSPGMEVRAGRGVNAAEMASRLAALLQGLPRQSDDPTATTPAVTNILVVAKEGAIPDGAPIVTFTPSGGLIGSVANVSAFAKAPPAPQHAPPAFLVKSKEPLRFDVPSLDDGSYQLSIAHLDTYALMSGNSIHVVVWCKNGSSFASSEHSPKVSSSGGAPPAKAAPTQSGGTIYRKSIPPGCAWFRNFGIVKSGEIRVMVVADGWVRGAGVVVEITRLFDLAHESTVSHKGGGVGAKEMKEAAAALEAADDASWLDGLPDLPGDGSPAAAKDELVYDGRLDFDPSVPASHFLPQNPQHFRQHFPMQPPANSATLLQNSAGGGNGIEVAPFGVSLEDRLAIIDKFASGLYGTGLGTEAPFPPECAERGAFVHLHGGVESHPAVTLLDAITSLPDPTPLGGEEDDE